MANINLLIIDAQWDFCHAGSRYYDPSTPISDPFEYFIHSPGALYVEGAYGDCIRLGGLIKDSKDKIGDIFATMDSHSPNHIAHCDFWRDKAGNMPVPFTVLLYEDVIGVGRKWYASNPANQEWAETYVASLTERGRNPLCTWPKHCIMGTLGWAMYPFVQKAVQEWCESQRKDVIWQLKGQSALTEMYSAVEADVIDPNDPRTEFNEGFTNLVCGGDLIAIAGQASSHCVMWTYRDMARFIGEEELAKKTVFLTDAMSPVPLPPCIEAANSFLQEYKDKGAQTCTCEEFLSGV